MTQPIPADVAIVNIVETEVFGVRAHHAECTVLGCDWKTVRMDVSADGKTNGQVLRWARGHAATHTNAKDAIDCAQEG